MIFQKTVSSTQDPAETVDVSVEMPADMITALRVASFQRQSLGFGEAAVSNLVREAVSEWLQREIDGTSTISIRI